MSKKFNKQNTQAEQEVFEIIELAIDDLELLSRAFTMINDVCSELSNPELAIEDRSDKQYVH